MTQAPYKKANQHYIQVKAFNNLKFNNSQNLLFLVSYDETLYLQALSLYEQFFYEPVRYILSIHL